MFPASTSSDIQLTYLGKNTNDDTFTIQTQARTYIDGNPLNVAFLWHQHQPSYLDPTTGYYEQPWVFMHGINDYPFMAQLLIDRPSLTMNMDLTGTLIQQLVDYANGTAQDRLIEMALKPNSNLTDDEKAFLFGPGPGGNLFDINGQFIVDKYVTVSNKRNDYLTWTDNEMNTAKVLFFLKWMNREFIDANTTLSALAVKALGIDVDVNPFTQSDVEYIIGAGYDIIENNLPMHKQLLDNGQLELITTPWAHPIGPLLLDTRSELDTSLGKATKMPANNTIWEEDFREQIRRSNVLFNDVFGSQPNGIWSPEQAVSPAIIQYYQEANINWSITAPEQLTKVTGKSASLESDLNQVYKVRNSDSTSEMFFVYDDTELSDAVGFSYASYPNQTEAVEDFMDVLYRKYTDSKNDANPRLATLGMDGENAWEWYPDNAIPFRNQLYNELEAAVADGWLVTTTVSDYISTNGPTTVDHQLQTGSWINGDFTTWIGEDLENRYWDELINARSYLVSVNTSLTPIQRENAWESVYLAQGSDWFWWAGADQDSGNDEKFDWAFKSLVRNIYLTAGMSPAELLNSRPFLYEELKPLSSYERDPSASFNVTMDGILTSIDEWDNGGFFSDPDGGVTETGNDPANILGNLFVGYGEPETNVYFRVDLSSHINLGTDWSNVFIGIYVSGQGGGTTNIRTRYGNDTTISAGFPIAFEIGVNITELIQGQAVTIPIFAAFGAEDWSQTSGNATVVFSDFLEISIPVSTIDIGPEKTILFSYEAAASNVNLESLYSVDVAPNDGPLRLTLPPAGIKGDLIYSHQDEIGDETGSAGPVGSLGGLEYGTNAAFEPYVGLFDLTSFAVYHDSDALETIFVFGLYDITNPWGSPYGLSQPGFLVYVDQDRIPNSGGTVGIENSAANIDINSAYEWAFQVGGWENSWSFYSPILDEDGNPTRTSAIPNGNMRMVVDPNSGEVRVAIADSAIGFEIDVSMAFIVATVSNDGFSVNNIRPTAASSAEYKLGGQSDSNADPNVIDILTPSDVTQLSILQNWKETPPTHVQLTAVGEGVTGIYDFDPPELEGFLFNGIASLQVGTTMDKGALIIAEFDFIDASLMGGIWIFDETSKLIGVAGKETSTVQFFLIEGIHTITVKAADIVGNTANYEYIITVVDGYAPKILGFTLDPNPPIPNEFVSAIANVTDSHLKSVVIEYSTDRGTTFLNTALSKDSSSDNTWKGIIAKFGDGTSLIVRIVASDDTGNKRVSQERTFSINQIKSAVDDSPFSSVFMVIALITTPIFIRKLRKQH